MIIIVMGVSGCGKSTIAEHLATRLGAHFKDGDELHPPENIALMASGTPLTDANREPWLADVRNYARANSANGQTCVVACSALKKRYRDILNDAGNVFYVFLKGDKALIQSRMHQRNGHFMPESLLDSQYDALESPEREPNVVTVDISPDPATIADNARIALQHAGFI